MKDDFTNGCDVKADVPDNQKGRHYDVFEEVVLMATHLRKHNVLAKISERVRFTRRRFGHDEVIDFLAVLFGYAISGERTLEAFYEQLLPAKRSPSWPGSTARDCPPARHSRAFWPA